MTISQMESEENLRANEQTFFDEKPVRPIANVSQQGKRNPPARNTSRFWFERFLMVIQRQNPSIIDAAFLTQIAPSNEGKLLAQLKFLGVIDEQGKPKNVLPMLNMVGEDQRKAFQEIARESYKELLSEIKVDKAVPDDLVNFFIRKYSFTRDKAINAVKFFLYLSEKGAIQVSPDLSSFLSEKSGAAMPQVGNSSPAVSLIPKNQTKEGRVSYVASMSARNLGHRKNSRSALPPLSENSQEPSIQAVIRIKLDKDTPKEYWDRVLALLGEKSPSVEDEIHKGEAGGNFVSDQELFDTGQDSAV